jgi:hypothetical protein
MSECPNCERQKQRVELWRQEAYHLSERQWVDLTDREMMDAIHMDDTPMEMGRRIEAKLKEKNT